MRKIPNFKKKDVGEEELGCLLVLWEASVWLPGGKGSSSDPLTILTGSPKPVGKPFGVWHRRTKENIPNPVQWIMCTTPLDFQNNLLRKVFIQRIMESDRFLNWDFFFFSFMGLVKLPRLVLNLWFLPQPLELMFLKICPIMIQTGLAENSPCSLG